MTKRLFLRMLEHNDWANEALLATCAGLDPERLDAVPDALLGTWSIRATLLHMADSQRGYWGLLAGGARGGAPSPGDLPSLVRSLRESGEGLAAAAEDEAALLARPPVRASDGYLLEPWTVLVQAIDHAHDHRRQVCAMLRALGRTPPRIDGWGFGEVVGAVVAGPPRPP
jgi:uncharacterized damage-inducible protein DinB